MDALTVSMMGLVSRPIKSRQYLGPRCFSEVAGVLLH